MGNKLLTGKRPRHAMRAEQPSSNRSAATVSARTSSIHTVPKVLLGWELGSGIGHVRPLQQIAQRLAAARFLPIFALKQLELLQAGRQLMLNTAFKERARVAAASIHVRGTWNALGKIVSRCQQLAQRPAL